jgi:hypothetical protein
VNADFRDILGLLLKHNVDFLVVGAHALAAHGLIRATGDLDIWVRRSPQNAEHVLRALAEFGAPMSDVSPEDFVSAGRVVQFGVVPHRIDLLTSIDAVEFDEAWSERVELQVENIRVPVLGRAALIRNKRATGRAKDRLDAEALDS